MQVMVPVLDEKGNKSYEARTEEFKYLWSFAKRKILLALRANVKALDTQKENGRKVGAIAHVTEVNTIKTDATCYIRGNSVRLPILNTKSKDSRIWLPVCGLSQLPKDVSIREYKFIRNRGDMFIQLMFYKYPTEHVVDESLPETGVDLGISNNATLTNGKTYKFSFPPNPRIKKLQRKLAKQVKGSNRYKHTKLKIRKLHEKDTARKQHNCYVTAKEIATTHSKVYVQHDNFSSWSSRHGKGVLAQSPARLYHALMRYSNVHEVEQFYPSTKTCSCCGFKGEALPTHVRTFKCISCGFEEDRDINAAINIMNEGKRNMIGANGAKSVRHGLTDAEIASCQNDEHAESGHEQNIVHGYTVAETSSQILLTI